MELIKAKTINYDKVYYYSIIIFAFILPISRAAVSLFVVILPLIWIYEGDLKNKFFKIWNNAILRSLALFLIFIFFSALWSTDLHDTFKFMRLHSYWLVIFVIATSIKKAQIQTIITAFLVGMFLSEVIAYGVFFELWSFKRASVTNPSPFMFWIDYSVFMAVTSILLLSRLFSKHFDTKEKVFMFFFFLSTTGNLFLGMGRTGQVSLIAGIIVMIFLYLKPNIKSFFIGLLLIGSIYGLGYTLSNTFQNRVNSAISDISAIEHKNYDNSWGIRVVYWMISYDIFKDNPILGVGLGDYQSTIIEYVEKNSYPVSEETKKFIKENHAHNQFLMTIIQTGLIGLILMLNIIYNLLKTPLSDAEIKKFAILFVTIYFLSCMAEPLWLKQFTIVLFSLFVGLFASLAVPSKETT